LSQYEIPPYQVEPDTLPPPILTSEPDSFARRTFERRIPGIVEETIELNRFPPDIRRALEELRWEIVEAGPVRGLHESASDRHFWHEVSRPYLGRSWLDVPWFWAETFFYRRILEATRYFQPGPWQGFDPYAAKKQTEWEIEAAPQVAGAILERLPEDPYRQFEGLLHASLWGNRTDLSYDAVAREADVGLPDAERANLLVDDTRAVWEHLRGGPPGRLAIIADNAGTELLVDLALVDFLLRRRLAAQVVLHLKPQPFFVSDTMPADVETGLEALARGGEAAGALAARARQHLAEGRLRLTTHWAYPTCLFYYQLPADLYGELDAMRLVIFKGDVNYRRLLGDAHWPHATPFETATAYFPAPLLALRTLKAELIVGLRPGEAERLHLEDPDWLVNARRGVVQARL
jgi:hypothetical protein